MHLGFGQFE